MITNLIASIVVSLVTNVTAMDNGRPADPMGGIVLPVNPPIFVEDKGVPATERYETIVITEQRRLKATFEGHSIDQLLSEKQISSVTKTFALKPAEWVAKDIRVNPEPVANYHIMRGPIHTNKVLYTIRRPHGETPFAIVTNDMPIPALKPIQPDDRTDVGTSFTNLINRTRESLNLKP